MKESIIFSKDIDIDLTNAISSFPYDKVFVLMDDNTERMCWPLVKDYICFANAFTISILHGESNKTIDSCNDVWKFLESHGATRNSLMVNLGGGMITDLGGFAASTYKRGIDFINIPTSLLGMVDASVGGKTGINFRNYKNNIGVFAESKYTIINTMFLKTLDKENILSGYAEMIKHALITDDEHVEVLLNFDLNNIDYDKLLNHIEDSIKIKSYYVNMDMKEKSFRKALNFGHTIGHALESFLLNMNKPILHGTAVMYGILCELYISNKMFGYPNEKIDKIAKFITTNYPKPSYLESDYDDIIKLMYHDKKNDNIGINCILLENAGVLQGTDKPVKISEENIKKSLNFLKFY